MLSPVSLRVCCLAVMAPALTKAVKQTDCLPVVLSKKYCDTETETINNQNSTVLQLHAKPVVSAGKRRGFMTKNIRPILRNGFFKSCYYYSLANGKTSAKLRDKTWHGTKLSTVPDKRGVKNTMNHNNTPLKNMGLAKANTSLSFPDQKHMNRMVSLPELEKGSNSPDPVPDLPDSTNSEIQSAITIMPIMECKESREEHEGVTSTSTVLNSVSNDVKILPTVVESTVSKTLPANGNEFSPLSDDAVSLPNSYLCPEIIAENSVSFPERTDVLENKTLEVNSCGQDELDPVDVYLLLSHSKCTGFLQHKEASTNLDFSPLGSPNVISVPGTSNTCHSLIALDELEVLHNGYKLKCERNEEVTQQLRQLQIRDLNAHIEKQLQHFVNHYQKHLTIPCQRQSTHSPSKRSKESVDLKAELLQSENVRNLSTAALVSFVRELESSGSADKFLPQHRTQSHSGEAPAEKVTVTFAPEDCADIKHTSRSLIKRLKPLLAEVDPDVTESSSDEETCDELTENEEDADDQDASSLQKRALWKWETDRAAIARRWTWLLMQIHEVMYRRMQIDNLLKQARLAKGDVCFEEPVTSESTALLTNDPDNASFQTSPKQAALKSIIKPVNGYLDHNSVSDTVPLVQTSSPDAESSCSRTRPLKVSSFRKRKLLRTTGLHLTNSKAARLSTLSCSCNCQSVMDPCVLCGGRYNNVQSVDPDSMSLLERIAILDPTFHPVLSYETEVPQTLHLENILKENEAHYQSLTVSSPIEKRHFGSKPKHYSNIRNQSRKYNQYTRSLLSAKYRTKHFQKSKHLQKRGLIFGKWRRLTNKNTLHARNRVRRLSVASSVSSRDSAVPSPASALEDGFGHDQGKRRQFDIDDVILPCNTKIVRTENWQYKEIEIPSWRYMEMEEEPMLTDDDEDISDAVFAERHNRLEVEEKKVSRGAAALLTRRGRRRVDSQTDPLLLYQQDIVFQVGAPGSPPPPPLREEPAEVPDEPFERLAYPLSERDYEELLRYSTHLNEEPEEAPPRPPSSSSTSTGDEDDDADPEWTVVRTEQALVMKLSRR